MLVPLRFTIQLSEFAKAATALALSKYLMTQINLKKTGTSVSHRILPVDSYTTA
jgi:cell division protein FtsW (lipid II flippase)